MNMEGNIYLMFGFLSMKSVYFASTGAHAAAHKVYSRFSKMYSIHFYDNYKQCSTFFLINVAKTVFFLRTSLNLCVLHKMIEDITKLTCTQFRHPRVRPAYSNCYAVVSAYPLSVYVYVKTTSI